MRSLFRLLVAIALILPSSAYAVQEFWIAAKTVNSAAKNRPIHAKESPSHHRQQDSACDAEVPLANGTWVSTNDLVVDKSYCP